MRIYPQDFFWGATLSAHQVEGNNFANDWWRWEQRPRRVAGSATSQIAAGHYARFETDFDLARKLGHNALLLSVEWSRIQPGPETFDEAGIQHYVSVLDSLQRHGLTPLVALQDVTVPAWFADRYGWTHPEAPSVFERYVERIVPALAPYCRWWIPIREPVHLIAMGHLEGVWPPGTRGWWNAWQGLRNLVRAHARTYRRIHRLQTDAQVGASIRARDVHPLNLHSPWDLRTARREQRRYNNMLLEALVNGRWPFRKGVDTESRGALDFIGISYYGAETVRFSPFQPGRLFALKTDSDGRPLPQSAYQVDPSGLHQVLRDLVRYGRPLLIAGNGLPADDDAARNRHLLNHVRVVEQCLQEGIDLRGYFVRSLLDGFEWTDGYGPRCGLIHVDRESLNRTPTGTAYLYKDICESGEVRAGTVQRFCPGWTANVGAVQK